MQAHASATAQVRREVRFCSCCSPFRRTLCSKMSNGPCSLSGFPTLTGRMSMPIAAAVCSSLGPKCFFACQKHHTAISSRKCGLHNLQLPAQSWGMRSMGLPQDIAGSQGNSIICQPCIPITCIWTPHEHAAS